MRTIGGLGLALGYVAAVLVAAVLAMGGHARRAVPAEAPIGGASSPATPAPWAAVRVAPDGWRGLGSAAVGAASWLLGGFEPKAASVLRAAFPGLPTNAPTAPANATAE